MGPVRLPNDGVCHVAAVPDVAVRTWPTVGAGAVNTSTVVVAEFNPSAESAADTVTTPALLMVASPLMITGVAMLLTFPTKMEPLGIDTVAAAIS
jgi:hypothetical protein